MRPNAIEIMRGLQYTLMQEIGPELRTPYNQAELQTVVMMLEMLIHKWDRAAQDLVEENAALRSLLERSADVISSLDGQRSSEELQGLARELREAVRASQDGSVVISALTDCNYRLKRALTKLLVTCEDKVDEPGLEALRSLRRDAYAHLRQWLGKRWSMFAARGGIRMQPSEEMT